jgi:hypothetical protein
VLIKSIKYYSQDINDEDDDAIRYLTLNEAKNLAYSLKKKILPGLNENERIHLIAMVDTIVEVNVKTIGIKKKNENSNFSHSLFLRLQIKAIL